MRKYQYFFHTFPIHHVIAESSASNAKLEVPSFTHSKDIIGLQNFFKWVTWPWPSPLVCSLFWYDKLLLAPLTIHHQTFNLQ